MDCHIVLSLCKTLREEVNEKINAKNYGVKVYVNKIFAKHTKLQEQVTQFNQILMKSEGVENVINVMLCTPNRLLKLSQLGAINYNTLKYLVLDSNQNIKKQSLFDVQSLRNEVFQLIHHHFKHIWQSNQLKLYFY